MKGIDISNYQGNVDFRKVKASGVEIVILKSTEGRTWKDSNFSTYYASATAAGLKVGVYHYLRNNSSQDEVDNFLSVVGNRKFDCKICIDMEEDFGSVSQNSKRVRGFADILIAKGYEVCIYSGEYFYRDNLNNSVKDIPVWVAHYGVSNPDMGTYVGHQHTETGRVNGICGDVDLNNFNTGIFTKGNSNSTASVTNNKYGIVTATVLNVRESASVNSKIVGQLNKGEKVEIEKKVGNWYSTFYGNHGGYVSADYMYIIGATITPQPKTIPTNGTVTANTLNVRSGPGINYKTIGQLNKGEKVEIEKKVGNWYSTYYGNHGGYVSCDYIK